MTNNILDVIRSKIANAEKVAQGEPVATIPPLEETPKAVEKVAPVVAKVETIAPVVAPVVENVQTLSNEQQLAELLKIAKAGGVDVSQLFEKVKTQHQEVVVPDVEKVQKVEKIKVSGWKSSPHFAINSWEIEAMIEKDLLKVTTNDDGTKEVDGKELVHVFKKHAHTSMGIEAPVKKVKTQTKKANDILSRFTPEQLALFTPEQLKALQ